MLISSTIFIFLTVIFASLPAFAGECRIVYGVYNDYKPYEWVEDGEFYGMNINILNAAAKIARCQVEYVSYPWFQMLDKLKAGEIDMVSSSINADTFEYAIPLPTIFVQYRIFFGRNGTPLVNNIQDIKGKEILLMEDSVTHASLRKSGVDVKLTFKNSETEILDNLSKGVGDYAFVDNSAFNIISSYPNLKVASDPLFSTLYGFIMRPDNPNLPRLNEAIDDLKSSGAYYKIIERAKESKFTFLLKITLVSLITFSFIVFIIIVWNRSLRHTVAQKTKTLNDEIEKHIETEKMLNVKTRENLNNITLLNTIINAIQEIIYIIDKSFTVLWNNSGKECKFDLELVRDEVLNVVNSTGLNREFSIEDHSGNLWKILILDFKYMSNDYFLLIVTDITENVRLRDELFMTTRYSALGEMSAIIAHEINTPLGSAFHNMDYLWSFVFAHDENAKKDVDEAKGSVINSLERIKNIVDELKKYTNKRMDKMAVIDLRECVKSAVAITRFMINKHSSLFTVDIPEYEAIIRGNPGHIEQMIINILQNSCYALTDKSQSIKIFLVAGGSNFKLTVSDEGSGMSPDTLKNACNPYFTTRNEKGGTGLGLSLTSRLIKEHNGYLEIKSEKGKGTQVSLYFPKYEEAL